MVYTLNREVGKNKQVILNLQGVKMYPEQEDLMMAIYRNPKIRYVVGACGTKAGKSWSASLVITKHAWENEGSVNWWVAPTYKQTKIGRDYIEKWLPKDTWDYRSKDDMITIYKPNGDKHSEIWFKTADDPAALRGFRVHLIIADEMAIIKDEAYESFRTTVTQTRGKIIFISTPKGHNTFYDLYQRGNKARLRPDEVDPWPDWYSRNLPTWANPTITEEDIEDFRRNMPERVFQQEVAAQFLDDAASVFGNFRPCATGKWEAPIKGRRYAVGLDLAKSHDFTVLMVMDLDRRTIVHMERFNQVSWERQYAKIIEICTKYNKAPLIMDATSQGDPIVNTLMLAGLHVIPYQIYTNKAKRELIENLVVSVEQKKISFPPDPVILREMEDYELTQSDTGLIKYSAPKGRNKFDDTVIALALVTLLADQSKNTYRYSNERGV